MGLSVENLGFAYAGKTVLQDICFNAPLGKLTVLLGRNGCGKSTLLKVIAGILPLQTGCVLAAGQAIKALSGSERARLIGYLPQFHQTVFPFLVEDVVLTGRAAYVRATPSHRDIEMSRQAMETVGVEHLAGRPYTELSGGERQMVMVARVLAQNPQVILLDEPTAHLDLGNQQQLMRVLKLIVARGTTILAVLHDPNMAFLNADKIIFLNSGRITDPPENCCPWDPSFIESIYGISTVVLPYHDKAVIVPTS